MGSRSMHFFVSVKQYVVFILSMGLLVLMPFAGAQAPISGQPVPSLSQLDTIMQQYMTQYHSPGASLSVSVDGRLVFARGYGYADVATGEFAQPDSLYRIASNSKPITAAGIYKLIEQGKLSLTTKPFVDIPGLASLTPPPGTTIDPRYYNITVQELLQHTAGFDDTTSPDPAQADAVVAATTFGATAPATPQLLIKYMLGQPLQHDPGVTYAYSNLGYIILGYIIEQVAGQPYARYIHDNIFTPAGIARTQPGATLLSGRLPDEVAYYDYPNAPLASSVEPPVGAAVPYPYGGYSCTLQLANGCWVSSPMDLLRFTDSINGQFATNIFTTPPSSSPFRTPQLYFAVPPTGPGWEYVFYGSLPGTNSLVHLNTSSAVKGRVVYAAIFNTRDGNNIEEPESDADNAISAFVKTVTTWPTGDLFPNYAGTASSCSFTLASSSQSASASGVSQTVGVTDANYCAWSAVSNASWLHVTAGALNSDSGSVAYTVDANTGAARSGTITIAGQTFTVNQLTGVVATPTTLTLSANPSNATVGQQVTLTATLSPFSAGSNSTNGETVTFYNGGTVLGTGTLTGGVAQYATSALTASSNSITAQYAGDTNFAASTAAAVVVSVGKSTATVVLGSLSATYDGNTHAATATTTPAGLNVTFTYNGSATVPTAAGSYTVVATINDTTYAGSATGTLVIAKATATVSLGGLSVSQDGNPHAATAITNPAGLNVTFTYNGSATPPMANGSYTVVATVNDANYTGTATGTLIITAAAQATTVTLGSLSATYDGTAHAATVVTNPAGVSVSLTYNGSTTTPTAAGSYTVQATVTDPNYTGSATGTLVIAKATATVVLSGLSATFDGNPHAATATTTPGGLNVTLTYGGSSTAPTAAGSYTVVATINDANYAGTATGTLVIAKNTAGASITLGSLSATYNGSARAATATTTPAGLAVTFTYNGSATAPTAAGSYTVVATINDANYAASTTGTLVIVKAAATVTLGSLSATADGNAHPATATTSPAGLTVTFTYNGSATVPTSAGSYTVVGTINDPNYMGSATGTLVLTPPVPDFTFTTSGSGSLTIPAGGTGSYTFSLAPTVTTLPGTVTFSASGLPVGATATFTPTTATGSTQTVTMTIHLPAIQQAMNHLSNVPTLAFALFLLPLLGNRKVRAQLKKHQRMALLLFLGLAAAGAVSGCGTGEGFYKGPTSQTYNVVVTATNGTLQHTANVTLIVQ